jgi:hypothetical protein
VIHLRPKEFREDIVDHFTRITELYQPSNTQATPVIYAQIYHDKL